MRFLRILGLDVGEKTIGVAISDPLGWTAQGLYNLRRQNKAKDLEAILDIIREYEVEQVVVGLPINMNGTVGPSAARCQAFGKLIREAKGLPVTYQDERLSTVAAQRVLLEGNLSRAKRKKVIDKLAAVYILQGYLDSIAK